MRLTKQTTYALRILLHCAWAGDRLVKASDIAKASQITEFNVLKIIPLLAHGGFVMTTRGRKGGLRLARPPAEIRIGDVVRVTEHTPVQGEGSGLAVAADEGALPSSIDRILNDALGAFIDALDQHTLQDLADGKSGVDGGSAAATAKAAAWPGRSRFAAVIPE